MNITIRHETEKDFRRVEEVTRDAFWNLYVPGCEEHFLVHKMRKHADFIKELSFVIEVDGIVEGAIFFTKSKIMQANKTVLNTVTFGPVCISPKFHRQGLGRKLITHAIESAKKLNFSAIIILGYPYHYTPYGFVGGKKYAISLQDGNFYKGLLVLPLQENALNGISGYADFSTAFEIDKEKLEAFDKKFPHKEKLALPCQEEFAIASTEIDEHEVIIPFTN